MSDNQLQPNLPPAKADKNWSKPITVVLGAAVVVLGAAIIYLLPKKPTDPEKPTFIGYNPVKVIENPYDYPSTTPENRVEDSQQPPQPESYVRVEWYPKLLATQMPGQAPSEDPNAINLYYRAGKVMDGEYKGREVNLEIIPGLGMDYRHYVLVAGQPVIFEDKNIKIYGVDDLPEKINLPGSSYVLRKNWLSFKLFADIKKQIKVFTDPVLGDFYLTDMGCLAAELPDHTAITYDIVLPFVDTNTRALDVRLKDNSVNTDPYTYNRIVGCGADCFYFAVVDETVLKPQVRLVEAGVASNGEVFYEYQDKQAPELKALYNDKNTVAYYNTENGYEQIQKSKYTYAEFLGHHPLLYWKDPLGRWIEFKNDRFQIAAEMCKPVIYLYPQKDTELSVKVYPNGGFTYTKPDYKNGWQVVAHPDGTIKNLADGLGYPYLFWEGIGLNYPVQESGFVVAQKDLEGFLKAKLSLLGLRGREAEDFNAYWLPRLSGLKKPYYKITFLKKEQMDEIAPLDLSVEPTSVIRVMMTAKGLDAYENIPEQELPQPSARSGFTLVEWGGAVLR